MKKLIMISSICILNALSFANPKIIRLDKYSNVCILLDLPENIQATLTEYGERWCDGLFQTTDGLQNAITTGDHDFLQNWADRWFIVSNDVRTKAEQEQYRGPLNWIRFHGGYLSFFMSITQIFQLNIRPIYNPGVPNETNVKFFIKIIRNAMVEANKNANINHITDADIDAYIDSLRPVVTKYFNLLHPQHHE